jgi:hypothetical protein
VFPDVRATAWNRARLLLSIPYRGTGHTHLCFPGSYEQMQRRQRHRIVKGGYLCSTADRPTEQSHLRLKQGEFSDPTHKILP